jgi:DNA processing protein
MDSNHSQLKYWLGLDSFPKFGATRLARLNSFFGSAEEAFQADLPELLAAKIDEAVAHEFITYRSRLNLNELIDQLFIKGVQVVTLEDQEYPQILREIYNPPFIIYYRGVLLPHEKSLAVVGTRKFSQYGKLAVQEIVPSLAKAGLTITSGLALGIDALVHEATLLANGRTIAVLGSGVDQSSIYPASNRQLADRILAAGGCILSEFPLGTAGLKYNFPMRNRIISGLSLGVLVIEAALESGSLITARAALEQNREVFAVPGNIFSPLSAGTNALISQGATPITGHEQILAALDLSSLTSYSSSHYEPENDDERLILSLLSKEPINFEELVLRAEISAARLNSLLMIMEIKQAIRHLGGMNYILN